MKKFVGLMLLLMVCCCIQAEKSDASTLYEKDNANYEVNGDGQTLTLERVGISGSLPTLEYHVSARVEIDGKTYQVTRVDSEAFHVLKPKKVIYSEGIEEIEIPADESVEEIVIPSTVKSICEVEKLGHVKTVTVSQDNPYYKANGNMIFSKDGKKLFGVGNPADAVEIPEGVEEIGEDALIGAGMTSVSLPDSLVTIGEEAFAYCPKLKVVSMGKSVKNIAKNVFYETNGLESITISKSNPYMLCDKGAIYTKNKRTLLLAGAAKGTMVIPKKTSDIEKNAFYGNKTVKKVVIKNQMEKVPPRAFAYSEVISVVLPKSVEVIGKEAFDGCSRLDDIKLPDSVRVIGEGAFSLCRRMWSIKLPKSLKVIKQEAFYTCGFYKLVIPENVKVIEKDALCVTAETLIFKGKNPPKMKKQEKCRIGAPEVTDEEEDEHYDIEDYIFIHGIGVVKVPKQSYKRYRNVLKSNLDCRKLKCY